MYLKLAYKRIKEPHFLITLYVQPVLDLFKSIRMNFLNKH